MTSCASCGHELGVGRFCTHCGAPVDSSVPVGVPAAPVPPDDDWRTDTAERRLPPAPPDPRTPPAAVAPPPPPRYPLYADEVSTYTPVADPAPVVEVSDPPADDEVDWDHDDGYHGDHTGDYTRDYTGDHVDVDERRSPVLWILATALVLVLVGAGWWFLVRDTGDGRATDSGTSGGTSGSSERPAVDGTDVAPKASVKAPETAPPSKDVDGAQVSYDASNMLDGVPATAWRAPGDASGMTITFTLRDATELHQVGLINGYAKESTDKKGKTFDWYHLNRRVDAVVWEFDDGTKVRQRLGDDTGLQLVDVDDVVTSTVLLHLAKVSRAQGHDYTAISEISLVGDPTG